MTHFGTLAALAGVALLIACGPRASGPSGPTLEVVNRTTAHYTLTVGGLWSGRAGKSRIRPRETVCFQLPAWNEPSLTLEFSSGEVWTTTRFDGAMSAPAWRMVIGQEREPWDSIEMAEARCD